jgi:L-ascorbate metabolism protein UlaG (beta-lactamase superfamily)
MKIRWLGHASFLITSDGGTRVITDPYKPDVRLKYAPVNETADIVTTSHGHGDHNYVADVKGNPVVVNTAGKHNVEGIAISGVATYHDAENGSQRGANIVFNLNVDGVQVCHVGDLGHVITPEQAKEIGHVDVLLVAVGGFYTIDAPTATTVADMLKPRVIVPMHFRNPKCDFPISDVEPFLKGKRNVKRPDASELEFRKGMLPAETDIIVLKPAR